MLYIQADNGEMMPLGHVEEVDLTVSDAEFDCSPISKLGEPMSFELNTHMTKLQMWAIESFFWGNSLYIRFPKKMRRKIKRQNRILKRSLAQSFL